LDIDSQTRVFNKVDFHELGLPSIAMGIFCRFIEDCDWADGKESWGFVWKYSNIFSSSISILSHF
jgi:hypothetical protein